MRLVLVLMILLGKVGCLPNGHAQRIQPKNDVAIEKNLPVDSERIRLLETAETVVFLGDSITYNGGYIAAFEAWLMTKKLDRTPVVINVGLPSETVSGLSEDGHAGGRFPRPVLSERIDRVLESTQPDLVIACYGINCGIYQRFDPGRFQRFQEGIQNLKKKVEQRGARVVFMTPPIFDDKQSSQEFSYNEVLGAYSRWMLKQRDFDWHVVDLHGPMNEVLKQRRATDPSYTFQPDAVHPSTEGHWLIATTLFRWFGDANAADRTSAADLLKQADLSPDILKLIQTRLRLLRDAYLTHSGHQRPGLAKGIPLEQAKIKAAEIGARLQERILKEE